MASPSILFIWGAPPTVLWPHTAVLCSRASLRYIFPPPVLCPLLFPRGFSGAPFWPPFGRPLFTERPHPLCWGLLNFVPPKGRTWLTQRRKQNALANFLPIIVTRSPPGTGHVPFRSPSIPPFCNPFCNCPNNSVLPRGQPPKARQP